MRDIPAGEWASKDAVDQFVVRARSVAPLIEQEANRVESEATVTRPIHDALVENGLYWFMLPHELKGGEADVVTSIRVIEEISRADGSTGWAFFVNAVTTSSIAPYLSDKAVELLFGGAEQPILAGQLTPSGRSVRVEGGYICSGKHSFASGSTFANWIGSGQIVYKDGAPVLSADGSPQRTSSLMPRADVQFRGNWNVMGLAGTGSYDYEVIDRFVPDHLIVDGAVTAVDASHLARRGQAMLRMGMLAVGLAGHTACVLGIAKRALEEIVALTHAKIRPGYPSVIAKDPVFLNQFAYIEAEYRAVRGRVLEAFAAGEALVKAGGSLTADDIARLHQTATWAHGRAGEIVAFCFRWAGTTPVRNPNALGRCMRDMLVANAHMLFDPKTMTDAAPAILRSWVREPAGSA